MNNIEKFPHQRVSMDSDTSGYSSSSISSRRSDGSFFNDHNYIGIKVPVKFEKPIKLKSLQTFNKYNDHTVELKDESPSIVEVTHSNNNEVKATSFTPIMTRRKSLVMEIEELKAKEPRRSRRVSCSIEKSESQMRRKSTDKNNLQFPKISLLRDYVVELKSSSSSIKNRRKSHGDVDNINTPTERKIITRRRSVYVARNNNFTTLKRRPSNIEEKDKLPLKKRRSSILTVKLEKEIPKVEDEVIEDVWFVSLVTIDRESQMRFLIKWDGHPPSENTYEPYEHIKHCEVLQEYVDRKFLQHGDQIEKVRSQLLADIQDKYNGFLNRSKSSIVKKFCDFDELEFKCSLLAYIFTYGGEVLNSFMRKLRSDNLIYHFHAQWKKEQESNFLLLETIMSEENYSFKLTAENNLDYEPIPSFKYLKKVKYPITSFNFGLNVGCKCGSTCNKLTNCCPQNLGWNFIYNETDHKLNSKDIQMIVECNDFCSCDKHCPNRPKEITVNLTIFKTYDKGWSVKTVDHIPAGKFVIEYTGEFLDKSESKKRARAYSSKEATYLFDLDYIDKGTPYSIDATHKGNIARFINHSCNPNLSTWPATTCNKDPRMHKIYYFSRRHIRPGEELTVDYTGGKKDSTTPKENSDKFKCHCGSSVCRGYIF